MLDADKGNNCIIEYCIFIFLESWHSVLYLLRTGCNMNCSVYFYNKKLHFPNFTISKRVERNSTSKQTFYNSQEIGRIPKFHYKRFKILFTRNILCNKLCLLKI